MDSTAVQALGRGYSPIYLWCLGTGLCNLSTKNRLVDRFFIPEL